MLRGNNLAKCNLNILVYWVSDKDNNCFVVSKYGTRICEQRRRTNIGETRTMSSKYLYLCNSLIGSHVTQFY